MFSKAAVIVLVVQCVVVFSAPQGNPDKVVTTVVNGNQKMQDLLDSLSGPVPTTTSTGGNVIKKTTTTTTTTTTKNGAPVVSEAEQLRVLLQNPQFAKELRQFLFQFLKMYNALHKGAETSETVTTTENLDIQSLMKNPSFVKFLGGFFGNSEKATGTGMASIVNELINQEKNAENTKTTVTEETVVNGHSRPVEVVVKPVTTVSNDPDSLIDQITSSTSTKTSSSTSSSTSETNPTMTVVNGGPTNLPSRYLTNDVTVTTNSEPSISTSENVLNELRKQAVNDQRESNKVMTTSTTTTNKNRYGYDEQPNGEYNRATVIISRPETSVIDSKEQWSKVKMSAEELRQQAKNAKYQFATQIDDKIEGNFQQRAEIRENGVVYGKYSYDDGYNWRTVYYEADVNGFRITKEEVRPSHMKTLTGEASVQTLVNGNLVDYHITEKDINQGIGRKPVVYNTPNVM